jgi:hypothetical protein
MMELIRGGKKGEATKQAERVILPTVQTLAETLRRTEEEIRKDTSIDEALRPKIGQSLAVIPEKQRWISETLREGQLTLQFEVWGEEPLGLDATGQEVWLKAKQAFKEAIGPLMGDRTTLIYSIFKD